MSVIDTPPPNRFPVQVRVGEYDADLVSAAIRNELARGGQIYYIHNRVMSIDAAVARVREAVPEARIASAHGKMTEHQLERVMESFSAGDVDVLVSTTIVESGIDNPHTNTLVIEDSERLGLAQLYQLKGRVGRSHVRAFAYFLFSRGKTLTVEAMQRLEAINELAEQGSGIKVAMRDLEIRGAGSLLGAEQHGQMSAVGFELYAEMLREAVAEARGEAMPAHAEIRVDLPVPAFLPEEYVPAVDERVRLYRRLAGALTPEGVERLVADVTSAYGAPPVPAANLLAVARLRTLAAQAGAAHVALVRGRIQVSPLRLTPAQSGKLARLGAIYSEKDLRLAVPTAPGMGVSEAASTVLDAILDAVATTRSGDSTA
jgi:transcription-repair coupling factor (superfamily II helicase)